MIRIAPAIALAAVLTAAQPDIALAQCAMCRASLLSPDAQALAAALRSGILFLLAAPFVLFGLVAYLAVRRQRAWHAGVRPEPVERRRNRCARPAAETMAPAVSAPVES